jgi:hypothetical protein
MFAVARDWPFSVVVFHGCRTKFNPFL